MRSIFNRQVPSRIFVLARCSTLGWQIENQLNKRIGGCQVASFLSIFQQNWPVSAVRIANEWYFTLYQSKKSLQNPLITLVLFLKSKLPLFSRPLELERTILLCPKKQTFSNFSCMFLNPNNFFQFELWLF